MRFSFVIALFLTSLILNVSFAAGQTLPSKKTQNAEQAARWDSETLREYESVLLVELNAFARKNGLTGEFRVKTRDRFLFVYDTSDAYVEWIGALLEQVALAFEKFAAKLEFELDELNEPLVVVVLATREEFDAYSIQLRGETQNLENTTGFYFHRLNRSVVYDRTGVEVGRDDRDSRRGEYSRRQINEEARRIMSRDSASANAGTIVHEATHQLAYNYGFFSRDFHAPDWAVEGMATLFEPTNDESPLGWRFRNVFPVNRSRLYDFQQYAQERPDLAILDEVILSDRFAEQVDDVGYAASWLAFYYCYRKRPKDLARFLKTIAAKQPNEPYLQGDRIDDFEEAFGKFGDFRKEVGRLAKTLKLD